MLKTIKALLLTLFLPLCGCVHAGAPAGPGMIVTFASLKKGVSVAIKSARLPNGAAFAHAGSFGPNKEWKGGGATMGAAPDGRELPEWVEFEWIEPVYPEDSKQTLEEYRALPRHKQRVLIRGRVPQEAVEEVMQAKRNAPRGSLPEKTLWVYFVWTDDGIKFRWEVYREPKAPGEASVSRSGGDALP
ncbi:MAG: hypothetical protein AB1430_23390 [Pseudomonadota bacterium]